MEKRTDRYLSTLRSHIEAMGGPLEVVARFPDGAVKISNLSDLRSTAWVKTAMGTCVSSPQRATRRTRQRWSPTHSQDDRSHSVRKGMADPVHVHRLARELIDTSPAFLF